MKRIFLFLIISTVTLAAEQPTPQPNSFSLGATLQYLVPNQLPDFELPISALGARIGFPIGSDSISLQGCYGSAEFMSSVYILEADYQLNIPTPFFNGFALAGLHYLHYGYLKNDHNYFGPLAGFGFLLNMAENFTMGMHMKGYWTKELLLSFGGSFIISL